jgi:ATP-dependent DNA helicase PIF1
MQLSSEQQIAFDKFQQGKNLFITGPGGSGKSALVKLFYGTEPNIQITALTGCAAILLGCQAKTIHSWAGIGLGTDSIENIILKIKRNPHKRSQWRDIKTLVIDEISMMSQKLFELINEIGKHFKKNTRPFGGIQIIALGDFYQLPPVSKDEEVSFCFESPVWRETFSLDCHIKLIHIFRQSDETYATILNQIREGKIKKKSYNILLSCVGKEIPADILIQPTKIFPVRHKVDSINMREMAKLTGPEFVFKTKFEYIPTAGQPHYSFEEIDAEFKYIEKNLMCEQELMLKSGSQVMCIVNMELPDGSILCNGSQGVVTGFGGPWRTPIVKFKHCESAIPVHAWNSDKILGLSVQQIPLILAWAITIHKSQGASLDSAEIDVGSDIFECGQTYVALSRVKSLEGLYLTSFDISRVFVNETVCEFYKSI